ncbi:MAG: VOC family protein [Thermoanaerobaculia bacterium]
MSKAKSPIPEGFQTVTPVLTLDDARKSIDWYKKALGAEEVSSHSGPDGKIMHAQLRIGSSPIMLHDAMMGFKGPLALGGSPAGLWIYVEDCDALFNRAVEAGGKVGMPMDDQFWGDRCGNFTDPFGFTWTIATRKEDLNEQELMQRQEEFFQQMAGQAPK